MKNSKPNTPRLKSIKKVVEVVHRAIKDSKPYVVHVNPHSGLGLFSVRFSLDFGHVRVNYYSKESGFSEHVDILIFEGSKMESSVIRSHWSLEMAELIDNLNEMCDLK